MRQCPYWKSVSCALWVAMLVLAFAPGLASSARALSLHMEFASGATTTTMNISDTAQVSLFASLDPGASGLGVLAVSGSVTFSSSLAPLRCENREATFNDGVGGVNWAPFTAGCGPPAGGISGQNVRIIEQHSLTSGTLGGPSASSASGRSPSTRPPRAATRSRHASSPLSTASWRRTPRPSPPPPRSSARS